MMLSTQKKSRHTRCINEKVWKPLESKENFKTSKESVQEKRPSCSKDLQITEKSGTSSDDENSIEQDRFEKMEHLRQSPLENGRTQKRKLNNDSEENLFKL